MLNTIKEHIKTSGLESRIVEEVSKRVAQDDDIRDIFLNEPEEDGEDDSKIIALINSLPISDFDEDDISDEELANLVEGCYDALKNMYLNSNNYEKGMPQEGLKDKPFSKEDEIEQNIEPEFNEDEIIDDIERMFKN